MLVRIDGLEAAGPGVRAIKEIPDIDVCLIEGPNGVGKTAAVRLLQLVTGYQPWVGDAPGWRSFTKSLRSREPAEIKIDLLREERSIVACLKPNGWPEDPDEAIGDWIGEISIDDEPASTPEVASVLEVVRFAGNEDLQKVILQEVAREHSRTRAVVQESLSPRLDRLREVAARIAELFEAADPKTRKAREEASEGAGKEFEDASKLLAAIVKRRQLLDRASTIDADLRGKKEITDADRKRLGELEAQTAELGERSESLEAELKELLRDQASRGDAEKDLSKAEGLLKRRKDAVEQKTKDLRPLAEALGLTNAENLHEAAERIQVKLRDDVKELEARRHALDTGARALMTIDELVLPLESIVDEGLGDSPIARFADRSVSAGELLDGVRAEEMILSEGKTPTAAAELDTRIEALADRLKMLADLIRRAGALGKAKERVTDSEKEVEAAREAVVESEGDVERYDDLVEARTQAALDLREAVQSEVELRQSLGLEGVGSREDLQSDLDEILEEANVKPGSLASAIADSEVALKDAKADVAAAENARELARRESEQAASSLRYAIKRLRSDPELAPALSAFESIGGSDAERCERLYVRATRLSAQLDAADRDLLDLTGLMQGIAEESIWQKSRLGILLRGVLDERLRDRLNREEISRALFEGHQLEEVDVEHKTLSWRANGALIERPLSSFSTGEQAFAFTQARVLALGELPADRDRLLVLDEFGSFVSADRLAELAEFLESSDVRSRASQVLVILPLQANYAEEKELTTGKLHKRYSEKAQQLDERGYIAARFEEQVALLGN